MGKRFFKLCYIAFNNLMLVTYKVVKKLILALISLFVGACSLIPSNKLTSKVDLECRIIYGELERLVGAEDFAYSVNHNGLFISSSARRTAGKEGGLFWLDLALDSNKQKAIKLPTEHLKLIDPHGIDILEKDGKTFLYVITHDNREDGINYLHQFEVLPKNKKNLPTLQYIKAIQFPVNTSPNDISVIDAEKFVTSFDTFSPMGEIVQIVDKLLNLNRGELTYRSDNGVNLKLSSGGFGNGVFVESSNDIYTVWWADMLYNQIQKIKFKTDNKSQTISILSKKIIQLNSSPDNIMKGEDGRLYIAAHYSFADLLKHTDNPNHPSPYVVYQVDNDVAKIIYSSDGDSFSAASTALKIADTLYIGQIYNEGLKACKITK